MNVKRIGFFVVLVLIMAGGGVFAHERGDLMLNIEPIVGLSIPNIDIKVGNETIEDFFAPIIGSDIDSTVAGAYLALFGTVHYYFWDFFGVNAGLGINTYINSYTLKILESTDYKDDLTFSFSSVYIGIPIGVRLSYSAFATGAGFVINIPIGSSAKMSYYVESQYGTGMVSKTDEDKRFTLDTHLGWYFDIGFDLSGIKERNGGFGMLVRLGGSLSDKIGGTTSTIKIGDAGYTFIERRMDYDPFRHFAVSLVFQFASKLASLPIVTN